MAVATAAAVAVGLIGFAPTSVRDMGDRLTCRVGSLLGAGGCATTQASATGTEGQDGGADPETVLALIPGTGVQQRNDGTVAPPGTRFPQSRPAQQPPGRTQNQPSSSPSGLVPPRGFPDGTDAVWPEGAVRNQDGTTTIVVDGVPVVVDRETSRAIDGLAWWDPNGLTDPSTLSGSFEEGQEFSLNPNRAPVRYGNRVPGSFVEGDDGWKLNTNLTGWMSPYEFVEAVQDPQGRRAILRHLADLVAKHDGDLGSALEEFAGSFGTAEELIRNNATELVSLLTRNVERSVEADDTPGEYQRLLEEYTRDDVFGTGEHPAAGGSGGDEPPNRRPATGPAPEDENGDEVPEGYSSREEYVEDVVRQLNGVSSTHRLARTKKVIDIRGLREGEVSEHLFEIRRAVARGARLQATYDQMTAINQGNTNVLAGWHGRSVPILLSSSMLLGAGTTATVAYLSNLEANRRHIEAQRQADERSEQARALQNRLHEVSENAAERRHNASETATARRHLESLGQSQEQFDRAQAEARLRALEAERLTLQQDAVNNFVSLRNQWNSRFQDRPTGTVPLLSINGFQFSVLDERRGRTMTPAEVVERIRAEVPDALSVPVDDTGDPLAGDTRPLTQAEAEQLVRDYYDSVPGLNPP